MQNAASSKRRPLFWLAVAFCAGICCDYYFELSSAALIIGVFVSAAIASLTAWPLRLNPHYPVLLCALCSGAAIHAHRARIGPADDIARLVPQPALAWVRGTITECDWRSTHGGIIAYKHGTRTNWTVETDAVGPDREPMTGASGAMRVNVRSGANVRALAAASSAPFETSGEPPIGDFAEGDRVEFQAQIDPLPISTIPDSFDYGAYLAGIGIRRMGTADLSTVKKISDPAWWRIDLRLRRLSGNLAAKTEFFLHGNAEQAGLLNAMLFGRRETLSTSDREAFAISGTAHLLAISGLHLQVICVLLWRIIHALGFSLRKSGIVVLCVCFLYCLLTGSSPPAIRSTLMFGTYVLASLFWREADPLNTLAIPALLILANLPQELFNAGFQLSFAAVFSLHAIMPAMKDWWDTVRKPALREHPADFDPRAIESRAKRWLYNGILVTLCATLATSPIVAWHMGRFSTFTLLVNLFALPMLLVCMVAGIVTFILGLCSPALGSVFGWVALGAFWLLEKINALCASLPGSSIDLPRPRVFLLVIYAFIMLWIWIRHSANRFFPRLWIWVVALPVLLLSNAFFRPKVLGTELTFLDLSRGRASLIETPHGAALIDAGAKGQGLRIAESLRRRGVKGLKLVVITADDADALDGAIELVDRVRIERVIFPRCKFATEARRDLEGLLLARKIPFGTPESYKEEFSIPGVRFDLLDDGPQPSEPAANSSTLCVRITTDLFSATIVEAKSSASLSRLMGKRPGAWTSDILRIIPGFQGRWPNETNELIKRAAPHSIVAGTHFDDTELRGVPLNDSKIKVFSPRASGSIKFSATQSGALETRGYRGGWSRLEDSR